MNEPSKSAHNLDQAAKQVVDVKQVTNTNGAFSNSSLEEEKEKFVEKRSSQNSKSISKSEEESSIFGSSSGSK